MEGTTPAPDERFAEWYVWAKREISADSRVCLGAAQAAVDALAAGDGDAAARTAARRSLAGQGVVLAAKVPPRSRAYAEWYDWARREVRGEPARLHAAARGAMERLERGGTAAEAAEAARRSVASEAPPPPADAAAALSPSAVAFTPPPPRLAPPPPPPADAAAAPSPSAVAFTPPPPQPAPAPSPPLPPVAPGVPAQAPPSTPKYAFAGFWQRVAADVIDVVLLAVGVAVFLFVLGIFLVIAFVSTGQDPSGSLGVALAPYPIVIVMLWLYFAGLESSAWQATIGKRAMGLLVTDARGHRISFGRATGRCFAMLISLVTFLAGFLLGAFTERRQRLHDLVADTLVVRRQYLSLVTAPAKQARPQGHPAGEAQGA